MRRRVFAVLMAFVMLFSAVPTQAFAKDDVGMNNIGQEGSQQSPLVNDTEENDGPSAEEPSDGGLQTFALEDPDNGGDAELLAEITDPDYPTDMDDQVYIAIYDGNGYPGEPAWYHWQYYTYFYPDRRGELQEGMSVYASSAEGVIKEDILDQMIQGPTTDSLMTGEEVKTWGYYNAAGTKDMFVEGSPLALGTYDDEIISAIKGSRVDPEDYEIIWYVIKFQTDTQWHIDGIIVEKETYNVNYYGNGNTSGSAPTGTTGLEYKEVYTVLGNTGNLRKTGTEGEWAFLGWNTLPDGSGTHYDAGNQIIITENVSLYAQWAPPAMEVSVTKVWDDNDNQDGIRPDSIEVHLLQNDSHYGTPVTLNASNRWTATWTVPRLDANGTPITYNVAETVPAGYTHAVSGNASDGFVLVNSHDPETVIVNVQKVWHDDNDRDGVRPDSITVQLLQNGAAYGEAVTLTENNTWTHKWTGLEKYKTGSVGEENEYSIQEIVSAEAEAAGYEVTYMEDKSVNLIEVINTREIEKTDLTVTKVWDDNNDQDGKRPDSITVYLHADSDIVETKSISASDDWKYTFTDLPLNSGRVDSQGNPIPIVYTVTEDAVDSYTTSIDGMTITNTLIPEKTSVTVTKVWEDEENQDGKRPSAITVILYANGEEVESKDITVSDNWRYTFADLPKYAAGEEIEYTVAEASACVAADGITQTTLEALEYTGKVDGYTITNTYEPEVMELSVSKAWNDSDNQDGKRPAAVIIALCVNGEPVLTNPNDEHSYQYTVTLTDDKLSGSWTDMPVYSEGQRISYSVEEVGYITKDGTTVWGVPSGYSVDHSYDYDNHQATVTNSYTPETITLNVRKVWNDDHNRAGMRPSQLTLELWKSVDDGESWTNTGLTATTSTWTASFADLPKYENGAEIQYTVKEQDACLDADGKAASLAELGYTFDGCVVDGQTATLTNSRETEYVSVTANKTWVDNDDQDGIRPESIIVYLYANGKLCYEVDPAKVDAEGNPLPVFHEVTVAADGTWSTSFVNLYKHYNQTEIVYSIVEAEVPGYTTEYEKTIDSDGNVTVEVINTHEPAQTDVTVTKLWEDNHDQDGIRPPSVKVQLLANGTVVREANLTASAGGWTHTFVGLPVYDGTVDAYGNPVPIKYTVTEDAVEGYTASYDGFIITNTHVPAETEVSVTKIWDDEENQDGKRPESITLYLYANGSLVDSYTYIDGSGNEVTVYGTVLVEADADGKWGYTWEHLDKNAGGKEINYTVYEGRVEDYIEHTVHTGNSVTITNSYDPQKTFFIVQKVWDDNSNQDLARPASIYVQLYADGVAYGDPVEINLNSNWKHEWSDLDLMANGKQIVYTVQEGYLDGEGAFVIGLPDEIKDDYYLNTEKTGEKNGVYEIVNTLIPDTTEVTVIKNWVDNGNQDGLRPDSITVELYANGDAVGSYTHTDENGLTVTADGTVTITPAADGSWSYTFKGLTKYYNLGHEVVYTVRESAVPAGYASAVGEIENGQIEVTNTHIPETTAITVSKEWNDSNNQDGLRPTSIRFELYRTVNNVTTLVDTYQIEMGKNWEVTIPDLPVYAAGQEITYTVKELAVEGYESSVDGLTISNSHTPSTIDIPVKKIWEDAENQDGKRPYSVIVYLLRNGQSAGKWIELTAEDNWEGVFEDLPEYVEGQKISYTVIETSHRVKKGDDLTAGMPEGYSVDYPIVDGVHQLVNSYNPEDTFLNVQKVWNDDNNRAGKRPASVSVTLYANGEEYRDAEGNSYVLTLSPANEWDATFSGMPKYDGTVDSEGNPVPIVYTVKEADVGNGYIVPTVENGGYHYNYTLGIATITNTRAVEYIDVTVSKEWDDNDDQDGIRPDGIELTLYANGIKTSTVVTVKPDANGNWSCTFEDLYKHYQGNEIVYSVRETAVEGYTTEVSAIDSNGKIAVTNTHTPEVVDIAVTKVWDDNQDQDGIRPENITVELYKVTGEDALVKVEGVDPVVLNASNNGIAGFTNLPKYENGTEIAYRVAETAYTLDGVAGTGNVPGYEMVDYKETDAGVEITNKHTPEVTTLTATKVWDDNDDQDGKRPDSIILHLLADGDHMNEIDPTSKDYTKVVTAADINAEGNWEVIWKDLPKYAGGNQIRYTVYEEPVLVNTASASSDIATQSVDRYDAAYERVSQDTTSEDFYQLRVTNTWIPETIDVEVVKLWQDDNDRDGLRPETITAVLYADDVEVASKTINASDNWEHIFHDMPKYRDGGIEIKYTVKEQDAVAGYNLDAEGKPQAAVAVDDTTGLKILTNIHDPATTGVSVTKIWEDKDNNDGKRPEYIEVALIANNAIVEGSVVRLSDNNRWTHIWTAVNGEPLYVFHQGEEITYAVVEVTVPDGYENQTGDLIKGEDGSYSVTITNTHAVEKTAITVVKDWDDADNNDGFRPESVQISLYRDGTKVDTYKDASGNDISGTVTLSEENDWTYTWSDLYVYLSGAEVEYTVKEEAYTNDDQYDATYSDIVNGVITVTNTHVPLVWEVNVNKVWKDDNDKANLRPTTITAQLYKDGEEYGEPIKLYEAIKWTYAVKLPMYENGNKIEWTVKETEVPDWYYASYDQDTLTIYNTVTATPKTGDSANIGMWTAMLATSSAAILLLLLTGKKKGKYAR